MRGESHNKEDIYHPLSIDHFSLRSKILQNLPNHDTFAYISPYESADQGRESLRLALPWPSPEGHCTPRSALPCTV